MPIHDWTRVKAGIFHDFHHEWISQIKRALNDGILPPDYYALAEQVAGGLGPDVLTLKGQEAGDPPTGPASAAPAATLQSRPRTRYVDESEADWYTRKKKRIVVRHVTDDSVVAIAEIVSPGNKASRRSFRQFVTKAAELIDAGIHLLLIDVLPRTRRDPNGIHSAIWTELVGDPVARPADPPLTLVSYEAGTAIRGHCEPVAIGQPLPDMPLFLEPDWHVNVPLDATYLSAFRAVPLRWRRVIESEAAGPTA